jgi:hypothetical protein
LGILGPAKLEEDRVKLEVTAKVLEGEGCKECYSNRLAPLLEVRWPILATMANTTAILRQLRTAMAKLEPYPDGVLPIPEIIPGTAFFPGGDGLWKEDRVGSIKENGVMVLGHNFDSKKGYERSRRIGTENINGPTWSRTLHLLKAVNIDPQHCFFTNFYIGLIPGNRSRGRFPGEVDKDFVRGCQELFLIQVALLKPAVIITLGLPVPRLIAPLAQQLKPWEGLSSIKDLNADPFFHGVKFSGEHDPCTVVGVIHPCYATRNIRHRVYIGYTGPDVEELILKDAFAAISRTDHGPPEWMRMPDPSS